MAAATGVATVHEPATTAGPVHDGESARSISRFFGAPWGSGGCSGRDDGTNTRGRTATAMADMRARGSSGIRRGWGAALADTRAGEPTRTGCGRAVLAWTEGVCGERTTSSRLADGRRTSQATQLRWDRQRWTSLGASCGNDLP
jgi:hypothetical protein